jgi:hypothetical protein
MSDRMAMGVVETAKSAGIGVTKIYEEIAAGRLGAKKSGKRTLIGVDNLRLWLANLPRIAV